MIKSVTIHIEQCQGKWALNIDMTCVGFDNIYSQVEVSEKTKSGTFKGNFDALIEAIPEALKWMGITKPSSEPAWPTQSFPKATSEEIQVNSNDDLIRKLYPKE